MTNPARQIGEILATARGGEVGDGSPPASRAQDPATRTPHSSARAEPRSDARAENDAEASPFERLVRSMRVQVGEKFSTARLRLHPPELGRLQVDVRVEGARAEVDVRTETQAAQELVAGRAEELRMALKQQGIDVQRIEVMVEERPGAARFRGERPRTGRDGHGFAGNAATQAHPTARTARGGRGSGLDVRV